VNAIAPQQNDGSRSVVAGKLCISARETRRIISNGLKECRFFASQRIPHRRKTRYEVIYQWLRFEGSVSPTKAQELSRIGGGHHRRLSPARILTV